MITIMICVSESQIYVCSPCLSYPCLVFPKLLLLLTLTQVHPFLVLLLWKISRCFPFCTFGFGLSLPIDPSPILKPYGKVSSAEHLRATSFLVHHKWAQTVLFSIYLHCNYCKIFSLQYLQLPAWPSYVLLQFCCKGKEEYLKKSTSWSRRNPHAYTALQRRSMLSENSVKE